MKLEDVAKMSQAELQAVLESEIMRIGEHVVPRIMHALPSLFPGGIPATDGPIALLLVAIGLMKVRGVDDDSWVVVSSCAWSQIEVEHLGPTRSRRGDA